MKINLKFLLVFFGLFLKLCFSKRSCKTDLMRSFHLHGRIVPNKSNVICPGIDWNCCTVQDQMKIHKQWQTHVKADLTNHYETEKNEFESFLSSFLLAKDNIDLQIIIQEFIKQSPPPSQNLINHLTKLEKQYKKMQISNLRPIAISIRSMQRKFYKDVLQMRSALPCSLCNHRNHQAISPETMTVHLNANFCKQITQKYSQYFHDKYSTMMQHVLLLDEFVYLVSNYRLLRYEADRGILHKYKLGVEKCKGDIKCYDLCKEFNLNKFSYVFDGDSLVTKDFLKRYQKINDYLTDTKLMPKLFAMKRQAFVKTTFQQDAQYTVLGKKYKPMRPLKPWDKDYKKYNRDGLVDFGDRSNMPRKYIEINHPSSSIMMETLDDQISSFTLFRIIEKPVDVSTFITSIEIGWGVNPMKDKKGLNLDQGVETLLAMLHNKKSDSMNLNEVIEDEVKQLLDRNDMKQIAAYVTDHGLYFKKISLNAKLAKLQQKELAALQQRQLLLSEKRSLFNWNSGSLIPILSFVMSIMII